MILDGIKFTLNSKYTWRYSTPGDTDADGNQIPLNHMHPVFLRTKDCEEIDMGDGTKVYAGIGVQPSTKMNYGYSDSFVFAYGPERVTEMDGGLTKAVKTIFTVHDSRAYTSVIGWIGRKEGTHYKVLYKVMGLNRNIPESNERYEQVLTS